MQAIQCCMKFEICTYAMRKKKCILWLVGLNGRSGGSMAPHKNFACNLPMWWIVLRHKRFFWLYSNWNGCVCVLQRAHRYMEQILIIINIWIVPLKCCSRIRRAIKTSNKYNRTYIVAHWMVAKVNVWMYFMVFASRKKNLYDSTCCLS